MTIRDEGLGFTKASLSIDGKFRQAMRFTCVECGATTDVSVKPQEGLNPEGITNTARSRGWEADAYKRNRCKCPRHVSKRNATDTDSELRKHEAKMKNGVVPLPAPVPREPTPDQRALIRKLIEKHFDEDRGCYLDGYDDEKVAVEAASPRAVVEKMRDAAYGPIKVSQEMLGLERDLAACKKRLEEQYNAAKTLWETIQEDVKSERKKVVELEDRVNALHQRRSAA